MKPPILVILFLFTLAFSMRGEGSCAHEIFRVHNPTKNYTLQQTLQIHRALAPNVIFLNVSNIMQFLDGIKGPANSPFQRFLELAGPETLGAVGYLAENHRNASLVSNHLLELEKYGLLSVDSTTLRDRVTELVWALALKQGYIVTKPVQDNYTTIEAEYVTKALKK